MTDAVQEALDAAAGLLTQHGPVLVLGAGLALSLLALLLVRRIAKNTRGRRDRLATWVATLMATALAGEGMWEVATEAIGLSPAMAAGLFAAAEVAMVAMAIQARRALDQLADPETELPERLLRRRLASRRRAVWVIAAGSGVASSLAAGSVAEVVVRIGTPLLAAWLWAAELDSGQQDTQQPTSWILTPRRVAIRLGLMRAGEEDVAALDRSQQAARIVRAAYRLHYGPRRLAGWHGRRLRRLTLSAQDGVVDDAVDRLAVVYRVETRTAPPAGARPNTPAEHPAPNTPNGVRSNGANTPAEHPAPNTPNGARSNGVRRKGAVLVDEIAQALTAGEELSVSEISRRWGCARSTASEARNQAKRRISERAEQGPPNTPEDG